MSHNNNPYSKAAAAYGFASTSAAHSTELLTLAEQRKLEGQVLLKAAGMLESLANRLEKGERPSLEEIDHVLTHNRKLWELFLDNMTNPEHTLPLEIKNNVASLAVYVFKRTMEVLVDTTPDKLKILIDINRNLAAGLLKPLPAEMQQAAKKQAQQLQPQRQETARTDSTA